MKRRTALILVAVIVLACYAVPYLLIGQVAAWYGSFLFWTLAGLAIIVLNAIATAGFGGRDE